MLHTVIITHADDTQTIININADSPHAAHKMIDDGLTLTDTDGQTVVIKVKSDDTARIYPTTTDENGDIITDGILAGALMVVKRITANAIRREGSEAQRRMYSDVRKPHPEQSPDIADMLSVAQLALISAINDGEPIREQYHQAYLAVNRYLRANRQINLSETAQHTLYIEDIDGDIISVTANIALILSPNARYIPIADEPDDSNRKAVIIHNVVETLTDRQATVLKYLAKGYNERQIAETMHKGKTTIHEHITCIRRNASELYPDLFSEYNDNAKHRLKQTAEAAKARAKADEAKEAAAQKLKEAAEAYEHTARTAETIAEAIRKAADELTPTARRVYDSIASGKGTRETARELSKGLATVSEHKANITRKIAAAVLVAAPDLDPDTVNAADLATLLRLSA